MGCILYELIVGQQRFSSDIIVLTHYQTEKTVVLTMEPQFRCAWTLSNAIRDMLQCSEQLRPSARSLVDRFSRSYKKLIANKSVRAPIGESSLTIYEDSISEGLDNEHSSSTRV